MNRDQLTGEDSETGQQQTASGKVKKISKQKEKIGSSTNLGDKTPFGSKKQQKVGTYKEKIKDIVSEDDELNQEEEDLLIEGLENIDDEEKRKSEKSKLSAKMTRKRRKYYIELLEKKVKQQGYELDQAKLKISGFEQNQKQRQNSEIMTQLLQERQKLFDKLEEKIKEKDDVEIECTMDSLRLRLGLSGKTRNQALFSFYDEIVKLMMPFHMKYLIWIATENIFQPDRDTDSTDSVWFQNSGMSEQQISEVRERILESKKDYDDIIHQLDFLRQKMQQQNEFAQNFIDDLRNFFPPINIAKFLVDLDKIKFLNTLTNYEYLNYYLLSLKKKRNLYERNNLYPDSYWAKLLQKNSTLNPLKNNQGPMIEKPFQNNPNILSQNTQIKQEIQCDNKIKSQNMRNMQSLNSSQCSFSVDQLGISGFISQNQLQQKSSSEAQSEDGKQKLIQDLQNRQTNSQAQRLNAQVSLHNYQQQQQQQNQINQQQNEYDKYQYKNQQQFIGQSSNEQSFDKPHGLPQYINNQNNYQNMNQNIQHQQYTNSQHSIPLQLLNESNVQNMNQFSQNYNAHTNNGNNLQFEYIPHGGTFQFTDPTQNFDYFLLQRDLN